MKTPDAQPVFNDAQLELLRLFRDCKIGPDELEEIKVLLASYFMNKARDAADKVWVEKGYNQATINQWLGKE